VPAGVLLCASLRSGFRLQAPAALTPAKRLKFDSRLAHHAPLRINPGALRSRLKVALWRGDSGDLQCAFERDGVLDQTCGEGLFQRAELALAEFRGDDLDLEFPDPQRALAGLRLNPDVQTLGGEASEPEVLRDVLADAAAKRNQEQFSRRHAVVGGIVFGGLVEQDFVLAGIRNESGAAGVLQCDFQKTLPGANGGMSAFWGPIELSRKSGCGAGNAAWLKVRLRESAPRRPAGCAKWRSGPAYTISTFSPQSMTRRPSSQKTPVGSGPVRSAPPPSAEAIAELRTELLSALVDNLDEAVAALGPDGQVRFANTAAQRLYGIAVRGPALAEWSQAYGIYLPDRQTLWPAEDLPGSLALRGKAVETEQYIRPAGAEEGYWIAMRARPLFDAAGKVQGALLAWRDVSEERQMAESRRRLMAIVENTPDCISLTDASLKTIFINRSGRELLGLDEHEDVRDYPIFDSGYERQQEVFESEVLPALLRGDPWIGEFRLRHAGTGRAIPVDMRAFGIFGPYGQLIGIANVSRDITERKQAEETRQRLASIVEYSHDAIISESLDGVITTWNRGAELTFGYRAEETVGRPVTMLAWPGYEDDMRELLRRIVADEVVEHYETLRRHKDGRRLVMSLTLSPVRDGAGKLIGISKVARDVTQQKEREELSQRQAQLLDQAYEPILVRDHHDRIVYWNKGAERLYGWTAQEAKGRVSHDLLCTTFSEPQEEIGQKLERDGHWEGELFHLTRSGHRLMVLSRWIRELGVSESHVLETNVDMSERQQLVALEEQARMERRFRQLLEAAPDAIVEVSADGCIVLVNRVAEEMFGYPRAELVGQSVDLLVPDAVRRHHQGYRNAYLEHPRTRPMGSGLELHGRRRDGSLFPVEISLSPIQTEGGVHVTAVIRDVTERRRAEQEVRRLQLQYTGELEARNQEIERANRLKSEFLASMSHELRTPLHTIIGFAELLGEGSEGALNEAQRRFLEHIRRDSEHLLELINDVLDLSKIEAGQMGLKREDYPLARSVSEALDAIRPGAALKGISIEERGMRDSLVNADPLRVKEMLYNLLSNAVKFTPEGGCVWIETVEDTGFARITVGDTGIGIAAGEQENIFDKFYQVGNTTRGVREGTGLGLSITKELVQMHGGWMEVESAPGEGSRFIFRLPLAGTAQ